MSLTGKQKRHLRALAHALSPVVQIGKEGVTEALARETSEQLETHELIKVKLGQGALVGKKEAAQELSSATESEVAQILGKTILLYRRRSENPTITLPAAKAA